MSAVLYGSISTIAKPPLNTINPILLSSLTYLIIGIVLTLILKITKEDGKVTLDSLKLIFITSVCGAVIGPILFFYGLKMTHASISSLLVNAEFLFSIILAVIILKEKPKDRASYIGIVLLFASLIILNFKIDDNKSYVFFHYDNLVGNMLIIGATIFWAIDNNISKIILQKGTPIIKIIQIKSLIGGLISFFIVLVSGITFAINLYQIPGLLLLSLGGFGGSLFLFLKGMKKIGTIKSVMIFFNI